jgi:hypothetical protein
MVVKALQPFPHRIQVRMRVNPERDLYVGVPGDRLDHVRRDAEVQEDAQPPPAGSPSHTRGHQTAPTESRSFVR